jgi:hypothetical protein
MAEASGDRIFRWCVVEREDSDGAVLSGSGTIVSQGFDGYIHQLETRTRRISTEEDRAMKYGGRKGGAEKLLGRGRKK